MRIKPSVILPLDSNHRMKPQNLDKIYLQVARENKISKNKVKEISEDVFQQLRDYFKDPDAPAVLLHNLGTFTINESYLKKFLVNRTLTPEKKEFWKDTLQSVQEYKLNKKRKK